MLMRIGWVAVVLLVVTGAISACQDAEDGEVALWRLDEDQSLGPESTTFTALVTRLECASGVTGEVLAPDLDYNDDEIVVTFTVADNGGGDADCPGNDEVPREVELKDPLGDRRLIDAQCESGNASITSFCTPSGIRYPREVRKPVATILFSGRIAFPT